jgi:hypothetical protein
MIVFDLQCQPLGHRFEGWFASSDAFAQQHERALVCCPHCGSSDVIKAVMAPRVGRKGNQMVTPAPQQQPMAGGKLPPEAAELLGKLAQMQAEAIKQSRWVGQDFADASRAMHYGEREAEAIHGQASLDEARELLDEGIAVMPLLVPVAAPDKLN